MNFNNVSNKSLYVHKNVSVKNSIISIDTIRPVRLNGMKGFFFNFFNFFCT